MFHTLYVTSHGSFDTVHLIQYIRLHCQLTNYTRNLCGMVLIDSHVDVSQIALQITSNETVKTKEKLKGGMRMG